MIARRMAMRFLDVKTYIDSADWSAFSNVKIPLLNAYLIYFAHVPACMVMMQGCKFAFWGTREFHGN